MLGTVAFQGARGAFSYEACLALRPWNEPKGYETFAEAIAAVASGECECGLIPVENSIVGLLPDPNRLIEEHGLKIVAEAWRPMRQMLMGQPDAKLTDLKTVESHPVALGQCKASVASLGLKPVEAYDTAGAAELVAASGDLSRAAIAPAVAAEIYELKILRADMQDSADNRTRFVVVER
ncbi:prephenate dehydratase domain-containing protein [Brevundimonas aveniformis]|uniref:prephenate dehydratase domain-containing protein n=1 Tax=Brevundimonas aveniformis TaxID=370977 RepID=UPI0024907E5D|nr:prephenate dehydratase domain-containing protein [Brevundimonas aveniformis]